MITTRSARTIAVVNGSTVRCLGCGQPTTGNKTGRCPTCRITNDRTRYTTPARLNRKRILYGGTHQTDRKHWAPIVATGTVICPRCNTPIIGPFDLGHNDSGSSRPEHPRCNRSAH